MTDEQIGAVTVLGAGTMGRGIAGAVALAGYEVTMRDIDHEILETGYRTIEDTLSRLDGAEPVDTVMDRIDTTVELDASCARTDLVIEAAPEDLEIKRTVFSELEDAAPADAILASNTSTLRITDIAAAVECPDRVVGLHFFNPPLKMDLVEVVAGDRSAPAVVDTATAFVRSLEKTPILVETDVPGFVVNNVLGPYMHEAATRVSTGSATIEGIDAAMVHDGGYPMGPFELTDLIGLDVVYHRPTAAGDSIPSIVSEKLDAGELGRKRGVGFYRYDDGDGPTYMPDDAASFDPIELEAVLINEAAALIDRDVADAETIDEGLRIGGGFPVGPCQRGDEIGLDRVVDVLEERLERTGDDRYEPTDTVRDFAAAGVGFFD